MESGSIESMPSSEVIDEFEIYGCPHQYFSVPKSQSINPSTTSAQELLECLACTNSMYPPIRSSGDFKFFSLDNNGGSDNNNSLVVCFGEMLIYFVPTVGGVT